jgi:hypothetical protein
MASPGQKPRFAGLSWARLGSNQRPLACEAIRLPLQVWPVCREKPVAGGASQRCGSEAFAGDSQGFGPENGRSGPKSEARERFGRVSDPRGRQRKSLPVRSAGRHKRHRDDPDRADRDAHPGRRDLADPCPSWVRVPPPQGSRERDVRSQRPCPLRRRRRCRGRRSRRGRKRRGTTRGGSRRPTAAHRSRRGCRR